MSRKAALENRLIDYGISLSTAEVAEILRCHPKTVWKMQRSGLLKSFIVNTSTQKKSRKTMKDDLIEYLLSQEEQKQQLELKLEQEEKGEENVN